MGWASAWRQQSSWSELLTNSYMALFLQEDWRATSRLTLNLGLRWDPRTDFKENLGNKQSTFIPGLQSKRFPNAPLGLQYLGDGAVQDALIQPEWRNLAPRVGLAYQINTKTVVRSAFGMFFDQFMGILNNRVGSGEPFVRLVTKNGPVSLSDPYAGGTILDPRPLNPDSGFAFTPYSTWSLPSHKMPTPFMQNWNVIVERQMMSDLLLRVGVRGVARAAPAADRGNQPGHLRAHGERLQPEPAPPLPADCRAATGLHRCLVQVPRIAGHGAEAGGTTVSACSGTTLGRNPSTAPPPPTAIRRGWGRIRSTSTAMSEFRILI